MVLRGGGGRASYCGGEDFFVRRRPTVGDLLLY